VSSLPAASDRLPAEACWKLRLEARSYSMRVAIIGAGPAGAMAAIRLARAGAGVQLFDASHPREKPCGGGVTGRALALIADVVDVETLPAVVVKSATVEPPTEVRLKAGATDTFSHRGAAGF